MTTPTAQIHHPSATLDRLLTDELRLSPTYQGQFSNHTAMALVALDQMGADGARLEEMFARNSSPGEAEPRDDVDDLEHRRDEVRELGIAETVRRRLPDLVGAPGSALFHPAIRLAYALDVNHADQVAVALLDWEKRLNPLPFPSSAAGTRTLHDVAAHLTDQPVGTWNGDYDLHGTARRPELATAFDGGAFDDVSAEEVAEFALSVHVAADRFVSLHMVTGARAVVRVAEFLDSDDRRRLAGAAARTMALLHAVVHAPALPDEASKERLRARELPTRSEIAYRAVRATDPHVVKLANVALVEEDRTGDALYRYIGARVVGL